MSVSVLERYQFRKDRIRKKVFGTPDRPRLSVYRSLKHIYAQVIDDTQGKTLAYASSQDPSLREKLKTTGNKASAALVGELIAQKSLKSKVKKVIFDRGGRIYHGCVKEVAESARKNGLEF